MLVSLLQSFVHLILIFAINTRCTRVFDTTNYITYVDGSYTINNQSRVAFERIPRGKRPSGRSRKRWMDEVKEDLKKLVVENWYMIRVVGTILWLRPKVSSYSERYRRRIIPLIIYLFTANN